MRHERKGSRGLRIKLKEPTIVGGNIKVSEKIVRGMGSQWKSKRKSNKAWND